MNGVRVKKRGSLGEGMELGIEDRIDAEKGKYGNDVAGGLLGRG